MVVPAVLMALIGLHLVILVKQKHTEPPANKKRQEAQGGRKLLGIPVWPEQSVHQPVAVLLSCCSWWS